MPQAIQKHIDYINPGIALPVRRKGKVALGKRSINHSRPQKYRPFDELILPESLSNCSGVITPACVAALYEIPPANEIVNPNNSLGIFEEGDYYAQEDLNLFFHNLSSNIPKGTHPIPAFIDGAEAPVKVSEAGGESDLDFELAYPIIYPQTITLYQTDDSNYASGQIPTEGFLNTFLDALDGVRISRFQGYRIKLTGNYSSHTVHTAHSANVGMIQTWTLCTQTQLPVATKEN